MCAADELEDGECLAVESDGRLLAVARSQGRLHVLDGVCPHRGAPLGSGSVEGSILRCPWHGWEFELTTGAMVMSRQTRLTVYEAEVRDGEVLAWLDRPREPDPGHPANEPPGIAARCESSDS